jgi:hypothetical protein
MYVNARNEDSLNLRSCDLSFGARRRNPLRQEKRNETRNEMSGPPSSHMEIRWWKAIGHGTASNMFSHLAELHYPNVPMHEGRRAVP